MKFSALFVLESNSVNCTTVLVTKH